MHVYTIKTLRKKARQPSERKQDNPQKESKTKQHNTTQILRRHFFQREPVLVHVYTCMCIHVQVHCMYIVELHNAKCSCTCTCMYVCIHVQIHCMYRFSPRQESYAYRDPITEFVECLYIKFDFDMAQKKLVECEKVQSSLHTTHRHSSLSTGSPLHACNNCE